MGTPHPKGGIRDEVLSHPGRYAEIAPDLRAKEVVIGDGERRRRYILCLNGEEADRQKWRRTELLQTLEAELDALEADHPKRACQLLSSKRFGPYLSHDENGRPYLDRDKVKRAEHLDGKFVLTTNPAGLWGPRNPTGRRHLVGGRHRPRLQGHADHRILLSPDEDHRAAWWGRGDPTAPLGSPADVPLDAAAHHCPLELCVLALMIQRAAESSTAMTWRQLHDLLSPIEAVRYTTEGQTIVQTGKIRPEARAALKKLDISTPKTILDVA